MCPSVSAVAGRNLLIEPPSLFVTQIASPSKTRNCGVLPTANVPSTLPSLARSLVTVSSNSLAVQVFAPCQRPRPWVRSLS